MIKMFFAYIGIYCIISLVWREYEIWKYGKPKPNKEDTIIALIVSLGLLGVII